MHSDILIIGSGFAAYQLIKSFRRAGNEHSITVITADSGDEYNKPDLSHVFTKQQAASDLVTCSAADFSAQHQVELLVEHHVSHIDTAQKQVIANDKIFSFNKLVLATGANTFMPPIQGEGAKELITHNSLQEYAQFGELIQHASELAVIGGGLIGVELALDLAKIGKKVTIVEPNQALMQNLLPDYIALQLTKALKSQAIEVITGKFVKTIDLDGDMQLLQLSDGDKIRVDKAILCTGLKPNVTLAQQASITTKRGIVVDEMMQTSAQDVYAIGDCAQFDGEVRAFLQPIVVSAASLSKTLTGQPTKVVLPKMMVKVKTPDYPIQLAGVTSGDAVKGWDYQVRQSGIVAKALNEQEQMIGFVVTQDCTKQAFSLMREMV